MSSHNEWIEAARQCNAAKRRVDRMLHNIERAVRAGDYDDARQYIDSLKDALLDAERFERRADDIADANDSAADLVRPAPSPARA